VLVLAATGCGFEHGALGPAKTSDARDAPADATADSTMTVECPATYVGGYRSIVTTSTWLGAELACEADLPGATHLVVLDDDGERARIALAIQTVGDAWVGIVRDPGGSAPWPWRVVTGGAASYAPWEGTEPNNMSGDQYVGVIRQSSGYLYDYGPTNLVYAICECDMRPPMNADYDPNTN
jgi:hypothetical protein